MSLRCRWRGGRRKRRRNSAAASRTLHPEPLPLLRRPRSLASGPNRPSRHWRSSSTFNTDRKAVPNEQQGRGVRQGRVGSRRRSGSLAGSLHSLRRSAAAAPRRSSRQPLGLSIPSYHPSLESPRNALRRNHGCQASERRGAGSGRRRTRRGRGSRGPRVPALHGHRVHDPGRRRPQLLPQGRHGRPWIRLLARLPRYAPNERAARWCRGALLTARWWCLAHTHRLRPIAPAGRCAGRQDCRRCARVL